MLSFTITMFNDVGISVIVIIIIIMRNLLYFQQGITSARQTCPESTVSLAYLAKRTLGSLRPPRCGSDSQCQGCSQHYIFPCRLQVFGHLFQELGNFRRLQICTFRAESLARFRNARSADLKLCAKVETETRDLKPASCNLHEKCWWKNFPWRYDQ